MAAPAQPQLVFVDGSFAELAQEMADYLNISDDIKPLLEKDQKDDALKKIIAASTALNSMPEKEFTATYNLLVYLVLQSEKPNDLLPSVCENLLKPITSSPANGPGLALSALTNIFNMLKPDNTLRQTVFTTILRFLKQHNMFDVVKRYLPHLEMWFEQWKTSEEDQRKLYEQIAETASEGGDQEAASEYTIKALNTFDETSAKTDAAQQLSLRAVRASISSPTQFDFQGLRAIPAIQALSESHPVYSELLDIFAEKDLEDYTDFCEEHAGFIEKEKLDDEKLTRKMRLLTFASLAASISSREIPYQAIAKALNISQEQVEIWTIDVIRAGLVEGRLSQQKQLFLVHKTTYRVFGEKQWRELSDRLDLWKGVFTTVIGTLRREQANADAQRKREQEDIERKLAGIGMGGVPTGNRDNRRGERPPRKERTDDDD